MKQASRVVRVGACLLAGLGWVVSAMAADEPKAAPYTIGADLRVREEYMDNVPQKNGTFLNGGENNYFRFRPRAWAEVTPVEALSFKVRAVDEWRIYDEPNMDGKPQAASYEWPEEVVIDNLYMDYRSVLGQPLDLRVGRQDLMYGNGRVILEGSPRDGSRTTYFNAIKATWKGIPKSTVDAFGIYNENEDELAINTSDRDLTAYLSGQTPMTESGGGLYLKNKSFEKCPIDLYYIFKSESEWSVAAKTNASGAYTGQTFAWQQLDSGKWVSDQLDLHTVGFAVYPTLGDQWSGSFEAAGQVGERGDNDVLAYMVDAIAKYKWEILPAMKPSSFLEFYYLSGDDPGTSEEEGWNPLWARYPQFSELYVYTYSSEGARWSNLMMPRVGMECSPLKKVKTTAYVGYLYAPEADGAGGGHERGTLGSFRTDFTLAEGLLAKRDKLASHVMVELLDPGDYYVEDDIGVFARWELMYTF